MHGDRAEANDFQADAQTEFPERLAREIKEVCRRMNLTPFHTSQSGHQRAEIAGCQEEMTAWLQQFHGTLNDFTRVGEMLDGVPQTNTVKEQVETQAQQITFLRLQSLRARMRDAGRGNIHTHWTRVIILNQLQKKAVGAADFQQAAAGPCVALNHAQMVAERFLLRGLVRNVIDVFAALEIILLVI